MREPSVPLHTQITRTPERGLFVFLATMMVALFTLPVVTPALAADPAVIRADATSDNVWGHHFGGPVTITVTDSTGSVKGTVGPIELDPNLDFGANVWEEGVPGPIDLLAGDWVFATDGTVEKSLQVSTLRIDLVDATTDQVLGFAPLDHLNVSVTIDDSEFWLGRNDPSFPLTELGSGDFAADFGLYYGDVIGPGTQGWAWDCDAEDDCTGANWLEPDPSFAVNPQAGNVWGWLWEPNSQVEISIPGEDPILADTYANGDFHTGIPQVDPGTVVTVAQGTSWVKAHEVTTLTITGIDAALDETYGTAAPGSSVFVNLHDRPVMDTEVVADGGGFWTASFPSEIEPETGFYAYQPDADNDQTWWDWPLAQPEQHFGVDPMHDQIGGWNWHADVTVTFDDNDDPLDGVLRSLAAPVDEWGNFWIDLVNELDPPFDVMPGMFVSVDDGEILKTHWVTNLLVDNPDRIPIGTHVGGTGHPSQGPVEVGIHQEDGNGEWVTATFDDPCVPAPPECPWVAEFSAPFTSGTNGSAQQSDEDGDRTEIWWRVPHPGFTVHPNGDDVWGGEFASDATVTITVAPLGGGDDIVFTAPTNQFGDFGTNVFAETGHDVVPGDFFTIHDGTSTKTHTVIGLSAEADADTDEVFGTTDRIAVNEGFHVWIHDGPDAWIQPDGLGNWSVDFSTEEFGFYDLQPGQGGAVEQEDEDGDWTQLDWMAPGEPVFSVDPFHENVWGWGWEPDVQLAVTIPGSPLGVYEWHTDHEGNFWFSSYDWPEPEMFDIVAGALITIDEVGVAEPAHKTHTVSGLTVNLPDGPDRIPAGVSTLTGTADPLQGEVFAQLHRDPDGEEVPAVFGAGADWSATFQAVLNPGDVGAISQPEPDDGEGLADRTEVTWRVPYPVIRADQAQNDIWGHEFQADSPVTITIPGAPVAYVTSTDGVGDFWINTMDQPPGEEFDLLIGSVVTVTDGVDAKTLTITGLEVSEIDVDNDVVTGWAPPSSENVSVWIEQDGWAWLGRGEGLDFNEVTGEWTADFGFHFGYDIGPGINIDSSDCDEDNDCTHARGRVLQPHFFVQPDGDHVWGGDWEPLGDVTITINGTEVFAASVDENGDFGTGVEFDLAAGVHVEVADGTSVKDHVVTSLTVLGVDEEADLVFGTAAAGSPVVVGIHDTGIELMTSADGVGEWTLDFGGVYDIGPETEGYAKQPDLPPEPDDGDYTQIHWPPALPSFSVSVGGSDAVGVYDHPSLQMTGDATWEAWVRLDEAGNRSLLGKSYLGEGQLVVWGDQPAFYHGQPGAYEGVVSPVSLVEGEWTHVAVVRDMSAGELRMYLNGSEVAAAPITLTPAATSSLFWIGHGPLTPWVGGLDEVAVHDRVLDPGELIARYLTMMAGDYAGYAGMMVDSGPVSYWPLDDASGPVAVDMMGTNHGTYIGNPTYRDFPAGS